MAAEGLPDEGPPVDGAGQRLADPRIVEGRAPVVGAEEHDVGTGLRVEGDPGLAAQTAHRVLPDGGRHVDLARGQRGHQGLLVGQAPEDDMAQPGCASPIVGVGDQFDAPGLGGSQAEGPRADHGPGRARAHLARALQRIEGLRERGQQRGIGLVEGHGDHEGAGRHGPAGKTPPSAEVLQVPHHRRGVERRPVVEAHALAEREGPRAVVGGRPARGQGGLGPAAVGSVAHQRLAHVGRHRGGDEVGGAVGIERHRIGCEADDQRVGRSGEEGQEEERAHVARPESACATSRPA